MRTCLRRLDFPILRWAVRTVLLPLKAREMSFAVSVSRSQKYSFGMSMSVTNGLLKLGFLLMAMAVFLFCLQDTDFLSFYEFYETKFS